MKLHTNSQLFKEAIAYTAQQLNLPEIYIEKDYWVTLALNRIFSSAIENQVVFKGGTALAKCFNLIERFSEDYRFGRFAQRRRKCQSIKIYIKKDRCSYIE